MPMLTTAWMVAALLSCSTEGLGNPFNNLPMTLENTVDLLVVLRRHLRASCVNILHTVDPNGQDYQQKLSLVRLMKLISGHDIPISSHGVELLLSGNPPRTPEGLSGDPEFECQQRPGLFVLLSASDAVRAQLKALSTRASPLLSRHRWVMFLDPGQEWDKFLSGVYIPFDSKFLLVITPTITPATESKGIFFLSEVYRVARGRPLESCVFGHWDNKHGLRTSPTQMYDRRTSLRGITIRGTTIHEPPITMLIEEENQPIRVDGYFGQVWALLEQQINFTTVFIKSRDNAWGSYEEGSGWNGMIRMILDGEVDVAVTEFMMTSKRTEVVDFTIPLLDTKYIVIARSPGAETMVKWTAILSPFSLPLWLTVLASFVFISILLNALHRLGRRFGNAEADGPPEYTLYNSIHYTFGAFCQQGHNTTPRAASSQLVYVVSYLVAVVLLASYSAALISFLTQQQPGLPFTDLAGLLQDGRYQLAVLNKSAEYNMFNSSNDSVMKELFRRHLEPQLDRLPTTPLEGLTRVCQDERYTFFMSYDIALVAAGNVSCDLTLLPGVSMYAGLSIATAKENPYSGIINHRLQEYSDSGLLQRMRSLYWPKIFPKAETPYIPVDAANVVPIFTLLLFGIFTSLLILAAELCYHRKQKRKEH